MNIGEYILLKLNINGTPIANKYFEGKLKNTLVRGWNRVRKFVDLKRINVWFQFLIIQMIDS